MKIIFCFFLFTSVWSMEWERVAVIVSSSDGLDQDKTLRYAQRDGKRLESTLRQVGMVKGKNIFHFHTESSGVLQKQLRGVASYLEKKREEGAKVFLQFYYSGHGSADGFHIGNQKVPLESVRSWLSMSLMDARLLVLDVCYGASFFSKGFSTADPIQLDLLLDEATEGEVLITSSAGNEQSFEAAALAGSIFTNNWIMALRGAGDLNGDGKVTLFESYNYSYDRTVAYSTGVLKRTQHPAFQMDLQGARDIPMSKPYKARGSSLLLQNAQRGLYSITDNKAGILVGEFRVEKEGDFTLALQGGEYEVLFDPRGQNPKMALIEVGQNQVLLSPGNFREVSPSYAQAKGFQALQTSLKLVQGKKYLRDGARVLLGLGFKIFQNSSLERSSKPYVDSKVEWDGVAPLFSAGIQHDLSPYVSVGYALEYAYYQGGLDYRQIENLQKPLAGYEILDQYHFTYNQLFLQLNLSVLPWEWKGWKIGTEGNVALVIEGVDVEQNWERPLLDYKFEKDYSRLGQGLAYSVGLKVHKQWSFTKKMHAPLQLYLGIYQDRASLKNNENKAGKIPDDLSSKETGIVLQVKTGLAVGKWL